MYVVTALEAGAGSSSVVTTLTNAFTSIASDLTGVISAVAPIAIGVLGAGLAITFGVKWFKRLTNKA